MIAQFTHNTVAVDNNLNILERLDQLKGWQEECDQKINQLEQRLIQLDQNTPKDILIGNQILNMQKRLKSGVVKYPLVISSELIKQTGYDVLRNGIVEQVVRLTQSQRLQWMQNFEFILTPDLNELHNKIANVRSYHSMGQKRNFLLGGESGMGKTTYLNWFAGQQIQIVETERNYVPVVKIDAPVSNNTPKPLLQRMLMEYGMTYLKRDNEEDLLQKLNLCIHKCGTEVLIVDEIEHIVRPEIRRRLLELSNLSDGVSIICSSCQPILWTEGDVEVAGRWNDQFYLENYKGKRLYRLLTYLELLLPFTEPSNLVVSASESNEISEQAKFIEERTGGILRDIMILIKDASNRAIKGNSPCLSIDILEAAWAAIQTRPTKTHFNND